MTDRVDTGGNNTQMSWQELADELDAARARIAELEKVLNWMTKEIRNDSMLFSGHGGKIQLMGEDCRTPYPVVESEGDTVFECVKNLMVLNREWDAAIEAARKVVK